MFYQWTRVIYSVVITRQANPPILRFSRLCNEFMCVWSMFPSKMFKYISANLILTANTLLVFVE